MHLQATCCAEPLPSLIVFPSLLQCPFCRDASWGLEKSGNLHKLGGRKRASCGLHLPDSRATVPNTAWPLAFIPALPPALSLCQRPRKLVFTLFQVSASPRLWASSQPLTSFLQLFSCSCFYRGLYPSLQCECWEPAFSTYLSTLWRENCFTHPREGLKLPSATSTSTFISFLSIWNREDEGETELSEFWVSAKCNYYSPPAPITGDFSE